MDARQIRRLNMALVCKKVLDDSAVPYPDALNENRDTLDNILAVITEQAQNQRLKSNGVTKNKSNLKETMALVALRVAKPFAAWARNNDDLVMFAMIDFEYTDLRHRKDLTCLARSLLVYEKANDPTIDLLPYGVEPEMIDAVQTTALAFGAALGQPRARISLRKAATQALKTQFTKLSQTMAVIDALMVPFRFSESTFYDTYKNARKINHRSAKRVKARGQVTSAEGGALMSKTKVTATGTDGSAVKVVTGPTARYRVFSLKPGSYTFTFEHVGYRTLVVEHVAIHPKIITDLDVVMVRE